MKAALQRGYDRTEFSITLSSERGGGNRRSEKLFPVNFSQSKKNCMESSDKNILLRQPLENGFHL